MADHLAHIRTEEGGGGPCGRQVILSQDVERAAAHLPRVLARVEEGQYRHGQNQVRSTVSDAAAARAQLKR